MALPVVASSVEAIASRRQEMGEQLDQLLRKELFIAEPITETKGPAFYLAYHGENDLELQKKIAAVFAHAIPSLSFTAPHCRSPRKSDAPIRVGIISKFFHGHSIGVHYAGLFRSFPREGVRYTAFSLPGPRDHVTAAGRGGSRRRGDAVAAVGPGSGTARRLRAGRDPLHRHRHGPVDLFSGLLAARAGAVRHPRPSGDDRNPEHGLFPLLRPSRTGRRRRTLLGTTGPPGEHAALFSASRGGRFGKAPARISGADRRAGTPASRRCSSCTRNSTASSRKFFAAIAAGN